MGFSKLRDAGREDCFCSEQEFTVEEEDRRENLHQRLHSQGVVRHVVLSGGTTMVQVAIERMTKEMTAFLHPR